MLSRLHEESPLQTSHNRQKVLAQLDYIGDEAILQETINRLIASKKLIGDDKRIARRLQTEAQRQPAKTKRQSG